MSIEFIGHVFPHEMSETIGRSGPVVQPDYLRALARAHEAAGFDRVLIPHSASMVDGFVLADQTLQATERLGVLLAHRPGFVAPTYAARSYATLDAFHPGRIALHVISGGDDADQARDGDWTDRAARYRRSGEFLQIAKREWASGPEPASHFDYEGEFYRVKDAWSTVVPAAGRIPIYFGGASADAVRVAAAEADVYALWGEPLEGVRSRIAQVQEAAAAHGRSLKFSVSLRPIVADTEAAAWERAHELLRVAEERTGANSQWRGFAKNEGSQRLLRFAEDAELHDRRLWTKLAEVTGAAGNSTALVGSHEQVAEALLDYVDVGATTLLIRGYEPYADAVAYGRVIELVRERLAARADAGAAAPAAVAG